MGSQKPGHRFQMQPNGMSSTGRWAVAAGTRDKPGSDALGEDGLSSEEDAGAGISDGDSADAPEPAGRSVIPKRLRMPRQIDTEEDTAAYLDGGGFCCRRRVTRLFRMQNRRRRSHSDSGSRWGIPEVEGPFPCEPPLELLGGDLFAQPFQLVFLQASGGMGAYRFEYADGTSRGLNPITGAYLSGSEPGVFDEVRLFDEGALEKHFKRSRWPIRSPQFRPSGVYSDD